MDRPQGRAGPVSFLRLAPPDGPSSYERVARWLRGLGALVVLGGVLQLASSAITFAVPSTLAAQGFIGENATVVSVLGFAVTFAITLGLALWTSFAYFHWLARDAAGFRHALPLGIVMAVLGAIGVLSGLPTLGAYSASSTPLLAVSVLASGALLVSLVTGILGVLIAVHRNKAESRAAFPAAVVSA